MRLRLESENDSFGVRMTDDGLNPFSYRKLQDRRSSSREVERKGCWRKGSGCSQLSNRRPLFQQPFEVAAPKSQAP